MTHISEEDVLESVKANFESFLGLWTKYLPLFTILSYVIFLGQRTNDVLGVELNRDFTAYVLVIILAGLMLNSGRCLATIVHLIQQSANREKLIFHIRNHTGALNPFFDRHYLDSKILTYDFENIFKQKGSPLRNVNKYILSLSKFFSLFFSFSGLIGIFLVMSVCLHSANIVLNPEYYYSDSNQSLRYILFIRYPLGLLMGFCTVVFAFFFITANRMICNSDFTLRMVVSGVSFMLFNLIGFLVIWLSGAASV